MSVIEAKPTVELAASAALDAARESHAALNAPSDEFLHLIPHEFARRHLILSVGTVEGVELLIVAERSRSSAVFNVGVALGRSVRTRQEQPEFIAAAIDRAFTQRSHVGGGDSDHQSPSVVVEGSQNIEGDLGAAISAAEQESDQDVLSTTGKAPTVRLVDLLLFEAIQRGASDVHVQPVRDRTLVRYRLDGALHTVRELPGSLASGVVSRIKVMARLDVAERRAPQDGRATVTVGGGAGASLVRRIDLRVSTLPSTSGERVVLRLLDPARSPHTLTFSALGMPNSLESRYKELVARTSGIVLSTGPTGSGKTTTLYTTLAWICSTNAGRQTSGCELNILTVEDPVEYDLSGPGLSISQTQVDPRKNVTFAAGLRHILRQDPDVIMVGEIRDEETARMAVQASLTGHLVLSTLHTNDAPSAVARLLDLGVEPFLVASSLSAVLAQRLVRTVHKSCKGTGCAGCLNSGFKGRTGVFEFLVLDHALREMVVRRASAVEIKSAAQRGGMVSLHRAGAALVERGETTAEELARVIDAAEEELS